MAILSVSRLTSCNAHCLHPVPDYRSTSRGAPGQSESRKQIRSDTVSLNNADLGMQDGIPLGVGRGTEGLAEYAQNT